MKERRRRRRRETREKRREKQQPEAKREAQRKILLSSPRRQKERRCCSGRRRRGPGEKAKRKKKAQDTGEAFSPDLVRDVTLQRCRRQTAFVLFLGIFAARFCARLLTANNTWLYFLESAMNESRNVRPKKTDTYPLEWRDFRFSQSLADGAHFLYVQSFSQLFTLLFVSPGDSHCTWCWYYSQTQTFLIRPRITWAVYSG